MKQQMANMSKCVLLMLLLKNSRGKRRTKECNTTSFQQPNIKLSQKNHQIMVPLNYKSTVVTLDDNWQRFYFSKNGNFFENEWKGWLSRLLLCRFVIIVVWSWFDGITHPFPEDVLLTKIWHFSVIIWFQATDLFTCHKQQTIKLLPFDECFLRAAFWFPFLMVFETYFSFRDS